MRPARSGRRCGKIRADYKSLYAMGMCYEKMGQNHQAIESYKSSLDAQTRTFAGQDDVQSRLRTMDARWRAWWRGAIRGMAR